MHWLGLAQAAQMSLYTLMMVWVLGKDFKDKEKNS